MLTSVAIIGLLALAGVPAFATMQRRAALRAASHELRSIFCAARGRAISRNANCGLRFFQAGGVWVFGVYDDGDGDGVRSNDIAAGIDPLAGAPRVVLPESDSVTIGLPSHSIKDPAGKAMSPSSSPVKFNASSICSFSPLGESTPGTIYLRDRAGDTWAVRVYGGSARIRVLRYDAKAQKWVP
jgi:Tfp pilus assembly protein FimT